MIIIGLCGRSGSGKSTVGNYLKNVGFDYIDSDLIAREVVAPSSPCLNELVNSFGEKILLENGELNRSVLRDISFSSPDKLATLTKITHYYILKEIDSRIQSFKRKNSRAVIIDAPLLFEANLDKKCDKIIAVIADKEICLARIMSRDNLSPEAAEKRLSSQKSNEFLIANADCIIENNTTKDELISKIETVIDKVINSEKK